MLANIASGRTLESGSHPVQFAFQPRNKKGNRAMARTDLRYLPQHNPCAQCGKPIATPEWIESGPRCTSYLWHCWACDYQFEAVAYFEEEDAALAA
jgi:Zn finger protein HypA/HybF involved in hydrogenase expression